MTDDDLKQIRIVVKEEIDASLEPVKDTLDEHTKKTRWYYRSVG